MVLVLIATGVLGAVSSASAGSTIEWSARTVHEAVAPGGSKTVVVSFTSAKTLTNVSLSLPKLEPYVQVAPSSFASIPAGPGATVTLTFAAPVDARLRQLKGSLRVEEIRNAQRDKRKGHGDSLYIMLRVGENHPPTADAGADQGALVGDSILLDGRASSDPDGQPLTYAWSLVSVPTGSVATLSDPSASIPAFVADKPGSYRARLTVNDGFVDSAPDEVSIEVARPAPTVVITAPENLTVVTASPVTVTGTVDDPSATLTVNGQPAVNGNGAFTASVPLADGSNIVTVVAQNGTGEGEASIEVLLNTTGHPVLTITSPGRNFVVGEEFALTAPFTAAQVAVAGVIKVNTTALLPFLNRPTVTVNGVTADVSLELFFSDCGLFNISFQCWSFGAVIPLTQGTRTITAVGTDVDGKSTTIAVSGIVDYCRKLGSNPSDVAALAGPNHDIQGNRCHEIDGCSAPVIPQECADDPMQCPLPIVIPGLGLLLGLPAIANVAPTAFGRGANPIEEFFVHGRESQFRLPCNRHDVCYQTCLRDQSPAAVEAAWHLCNQQQYARMLSVCNTAYPPTCPHTLIGGIPDPFMCARWFQEKNTCALLAGIYTEAVESGAGLDAFEQRQTEYCRSN